MYITILVNIEITSHLYYSGAATIRLEMPSHMQNSLIFHYNLKFYGNDTDNYDGISLKRFVMQVGDLPSLNLIPKYFLQILL